MRLQELIHNLEEGAGRKLISIAAALVSMVALMLLFDTLFFRNMSTSEGMEASQLARNISEGQGYRSLMIRPLAVYLIQKQRGETGALIKEVYPDIQTPPVYPVLLAGWLKIMPFSWKIDTGKNFEKHWPDLWVAVFHQLLLLAAAILIYRLAGALFDVTASWMAAGLFVGTWFYWQLTFTGHGGLLMVVFFLLLATALLKIDQLAAENAPVGKLVTWSVLAGLWLGLGSLTRYSFVWLAIPTLMFLFLFIRPIKWIAGGVTLATFLLIFTPWVVRNVQVSGAPFGTAGFAIYSGTESFPDDEIERALHPKFESFDYQEVRRKFINNLREMTVVELPRLGGNLAAILSVVGLLVPFRRPVLNRLRWFAFLSVFFLLLAQAGGRTHLAKESPDISSENLLAIVAPLTMIFGVGLILNLVAQIKIEHPVRQFLVILGAGGVCCIPMLLAFIPPFPYVSSVVYPPYYPPFIQQVGRLNDRGTGSRWERELLMTDVPAAVSWYGRCPSVTLTLNYRNDPADKIKDDFFEFSDYRKTIKGIYLTQRSLKSISVKGVAETSKDIRSKWENFIGSIMDKGELPSEFPLQNWAKRVWPEQLFADSAAVR